MLDLFTGFAHALSLNAAKFATLMTGNAPLDALAGGTALWQWAALERMARGILALAF